MFSVWCTIISLPLKHFWKWYLWLESLSKLQWELNCKLNWDVKDSQLRAAICGGLSCLPVCFGRFLAGLSEILWVWVHGACMSVSRCGLLPMYPHSEGSDSPAAARTHRQTHLRCRWVENSNCATAFSWEDSNFTACSLIFLFKCFTVVF